jgi:acyl-CoA synthetase (AMP-forming)/AMP-acid ligase II
MMQTEHVLTLASGGQGPHEALANCRSIIEVVRMRAMCDPDKRALMFLKDGADDIEQWTYGELWGRASRVARHLDQLGTAGKRAVLLYEPGLEYIAAFLGSLQAGAVAVTSYPPSGTRATQRMFGIIEDAQPAVVLSTSRIRASEAKLRPDFWSLHGAQWVATDALPNLSAVELPAAPMVTGQPLAMLQYTSGSTSRPKGVMVTHRNLLSNCEACHDWLQPGPHWVGCSWLPPYHDMGLMGGLLQPLYDGFPVVLMAPGHFIQRPERWLRAISRFRCTATGAPNFAFDLCTNEIDDRELDSIDLSCLEVAFCGAEPVRAETLLRFARRFARCGFRAAALNPCYGMAEATLMVSGKPAGSAMRHGFFDQAALAAGRVTEGDTQDEKRALTSCGRVARNLTVRIVDPDTMEPSLPETIGEIWVAGEHVAAGYWNRGEESEQAFGARLAGDDREYLRTGDLGFLRGGELFITGRIKDLIIIAGRNHYPQDIELTVQSAHAAIQANGVAAFPVEAEDGETLVVVAEIRRAGRSHGTDDLDAIRHAVVRMVTQVHGLRPADVHLGPFGTVPRTTSGKIQRQACKRAYLDGRAARSK